MIVRTEKNKNYTIIANYALNDPNLSLKAKGLWTVIMSKPDEWNINSRGLASELKEGREAIMSALNELEEHGYLQRGKPRKKNGQYYQTENVLYEFPWSENPTTENPTTNINTEQVIKNSKKRYRDEVTEENYRAIARILKDSDKSRFLDERKRKFNARLAEYTLDDILIAARNLSKSAFHMGDNPDKKKYATFDFLMRNDSQIDKWLNMEDNQPAPGWGFQNKKRKEEE